MFFSREFLASFLKRVLLIISEKGLTGEERDRRELAELFNLNIKKKNDWTLPDFLIELEACLAFFYASNNKPAWLTEHHFEILLNELSKRVDQHLEAEISKLRHDADFIKKKSSVVDSRRDLGELMPGSKNIVI